jgi:hypothetical protein
MDNKSHFLTEHCLFNYAPISSARGVKYPIGIRLSEREVAIERNSGHTSRMSLADNLSNLLADTGKCCASAALGNFIPTVCGEIAARLPLTHARTSEQFVRITDDAKGLGYKIFSPAKVAEHFGRSVRTESAEAVLGTEQFVFLYCGQFRYPQTQVGFLFSTHFEGECRGTSEASPFDSGALHKHASWPDSRESARAFLSRHSLPVPEYRDLLAPRLHLLFDAPQDYVTRSSPPVRSDPIGLRPKMPSAVPDPRLWTFEIRVRDEMSLSKPHLLAVFYVARLESHPSVIQFLAAQDANLHVEPIFSDDDDAFSALQNRCLDYLREQGMIPE